MARTLDMQFIRYMNLFTKITKVRAQHCFSYNNMLIFVVSKSEVMRAIGKDNINLQKISRILHKRIRIVAQPKGKTPVDVETFVKTIVSPVEFNTFEIKNNEAIITTAGREGKARLIGRQRIRQKELQDILEQYFGIKRLNIA
jgi:NusA-like KH domain protein